jgi:hypothetical protein
MNGDQHRISWPWFIFGCILFLVAVVAFFWAFALGNLTREQHFLLMWLLPLASGFACGCFYGSLSTSGLVGGLTTAAAGGFAVWLLSFFLLPNPEIPIAPPSISMAFEKGTSIRQAAELITRRDGFSAEFTCTEDFLKAEVQTSTMTAKGVQELLEKLGLQTVDGSLRRRLRVTRLVDKGVYEIHCE